MSDLLSAWKGDPEVTTEMFRLNQVAESMNCMKEDIMLNGICREDAVALEQYAPGIFGDFRVGKFTTMHSETGKTIALEGIDWKRGTFIAAAIVAGITLLIKIFNWIASKLSNKKSAGVSKDYKKVNKEINELIKPMTLEEAASDPELKKTSSFFARYAQLLNKSLGRVYLKSLQQYADSDRFPTDLNPSETAAACDLYSRTVKRISNSDKLVHAIHGYIFLNRSNRFTGAVSMIDFGQRTKSRHGMIPKDLDVSIDNLVSNCEAVIVSYRNTLRLIERMNPKDIETVELPDPKRNRRGTFYDGKPGTTGGEIFDSISTLQRRAIEFSNKVKNRNQKIFHNWLTVKASGERAHANSMNIEDTTEVTILPEIAEMFKTFKIEAKRQPTYWNVGEFTKVPDEKRILIKDYAATIEDLAQLKYREKMADMIERYMVDSHTSKDGKYNELLDYLTSDVADLAKEFEVVSRLVKDKRYNFLTGEIWRKGSPADDGTNLGTVVIPFNTLKSAFSVINSAMMAAMKALDIIIVSSTVMTHAITEVHEAATLGKKLLDEENSK